MNLDRQVIVTTTQALEGWKVEEYLGPVSAHIVAGTGFFSDFAASFSDIFGGRSHSYQKQLTRINEEVTNQLMARTVQKGGNCILGFRIDHDEISGKAKQMFMVTATGTAATVSRTSKVEKQGTERHIAVATDLRAELHKRKMLKELENPQSVFHEIKWDYFRENEISEAAPKLLDLVIKQGESAPLTWETNWKTFFDYLSAIPLQEAKTHLYEYLRANDERIDEVVAAVDDLALFDAKIIHEFLKSPKRSLHLTALKLFKTYKEFYESKDVRELQELFNELSESFPRKTLESDKQGLLKSRDVKVWTCECGEKNEEERKQCKKCKRDIYGIPQGYPNPDDLRIFLAERIEAIKTLID